MGSRKAAHIAPGDRAVAEALSGLTRFGEAAQILTVGRTGSGKTHGLRALAQGWLRATPGLLIVVDSKAERRYDDLVAPALVCVRESPADYKARPPLPGNRVVIFRAGVGRELDEVAISEFGWGLASLRKKTCTLRDEAVPSAARNMQWRRGHARVAQEYLQGRSWHRSIITSTTALRDLPVDCADNADEAWVFQTRGKGLAVLEDRDYLHGVPDGLIPSLKGKEAAPAERGEFLRLRSGVPWDGLIYRFGAAGAPAAK